MLEGYVQRDTLQMCEGWRTTGRASAGAGVNSSSTDATPRPEGRGGRKHYCRWLGMNSQKSAALKEAVIFDQGT